MCLVANTPSYAYRHLKDTLAVHTMARRFPWDVFAKLEDPWAEDVQIAVCLMALRILGGAYVLARLVKWVPPQRRWIPALKELVVSDIAASVESKEY